MALSTGHDIADRLHRLIDGWGDLDDEEHAHVRRTVAYVVDPDDGSYDFLD